MATLIRFEEQFEIPMDIRSLDDFRHWATSGQFPREGRIDYLGGCIEVDMSPEDLHTHGKLKIELVSVLWQRIKQLQLGELYTDSARVSCPAAELSAEPDLVFVSESALQVGRVQFVSKAGGAPDRYIELEGAPDLVVEIVSDASARKDTERLPAAYHRAGIEEFWLVDARQPNLVFLVFRRGPEAYEPVEADGAGYRYSSALDCHYRLERSRNKQGRLTFDLLARER
jgi:Uma2 family endonuclease